MVELHTEYIGNELTATIDNQTITLNMNKIVKAPTVFICNSNLNTVINAPIDIDLFLGYEVANDESIELINEEDIIEFEEFSLKGVEKGFINLKITSVSQQIQYYENRYNFTDGQIIDTINLPLPIGEYLLTADYIGNKYYEPGTITINFEVGKRNAKCIFESTDVQAYPNENIQIGLTLIDDMSGKKISNCLLNYYFNGYEYITQTNEQGYCNLNITTPDINPDICPLNTITINQDLEVTEEIEDGVYYYDDDGNIQYANDLTTFINDISEEEAEFLEVDTPLEEDIEDGYENEEDTEQTYTLVPTYPLEVAINSTTYVLISENIINILLKSYRTEINYQTTNDGYRIHVEGDVIAYDDNDNLVNVEYGNVNFDISELMPHPNKTNTIDSNGHFSFDTEIIEAESANVSPQPTKLFSTSKTTQIGLTSKSDLIVSRNYAEGHHVSFQASVTTNRISVPYGMVTFIITKDCKEVYRYITEVDVNGEAFFNFDVSTLGEYEIQAHYHEIFEYQESESNIITYNIIEDE